MSVELGLRFSIVGGFPDSLSCIPDFKSQNSGLKKKFSYLYRYLKPLILLFIQTEKGRGRKGGESEGSDLFACP